MRRQSLKCVLRARCNVFAFGRDFYIRTRVRLEYEFSILEANDAQSERVRANLAHRTDSAMPFSNHRRPATPG